MKTIFFDLDDTIYDRGIPFRRAFARLFNNWDERMAKAAYETCRIRGVECFDDSQTGKITMDEMYIYRYTKGMADIGLTITPEQALKFQAVYAEYQSRLEMTSRMCRILDYCKTHFDRIGIITNGPGQHQRNKLSCLRMERWIDPSLIFISEECNSIKPDAGMFLMAAKAVGKEADDLIYVGDSYNSDMATPIKLGWRTIWLNKNHTTPASDLPCPDENVEDENELWLAIQAY